MGATYFPAELPPGPIPGSFYDLPELTPEQGKQLPASVSGAGIAFSAFPSAASAGNGALQWESTFGILLLSDGTYWRPAGGRQLIRRLGADWVGAATGAGQVIDSFSLPAGLLFPGGALHVKLCADRFAGTTDTAFFRVKAAGQALISPGLSGANISAGGEWRVKRESATTIRKVDPGANNVWAPTAGLQTATRAAAVTVPDMDANATTIELSATMVSGATEYPGVSCYAVELVG